MVFPAGQASAVGGEFMLLRVRMAGGAGTSR